ncbi:MAG TPA: hypothetical protein VK822_26370 [Acetobacteraceae bacterium]|jgi:hypothetical protein|nr:hypothetical protein [Acetobacteraceae bacterium]
MAIDTQALVNAMVSAGQNLGSTLLSQASSYALPEFTKIASQIVAIEFHSADYTEAGARALLDMQMRASAGVIVAMTSLVLLDVQNAINAILQAVKGVVNQAVGFALIV